MMRKIVRITSKVIIALALALLAAIALLPWIIGSAGGAGAGMIAYALVLYGAVFGVPAVIGLLAIGGIGMLFSGRQA